MLTRRALVRAAGIAAVSLTGCAPLPHRPAPHLGDATGAGPGYELRPAGEALWICGEDGVLQALDARTDTVSARVPLEMKLPERSAPELFAGSALWAYEFQTGAVVAVDPATARITGRARLPGAANLVGLVSLAAHGTLWVAYHGGVRRVDRTGGTRHTPLPPGFAPTAATATARHLWLAGEGTLLRLDPGGAAPLSVPLPVGVEVEELTATTSALYSLPGSARQLSSFDPVTGAHRSTQDLSAAARALHAVGDTLWIADDDHIHRVRATGLDSPPIEVGEYYADSSAVLDGGLWVGISGLNEVHRLDLTTGRTTARVPVEVAEEDDPAFAVYAGARTLWVLDGDFFNGIARIDPVAGRERKLIPTTGIDIQYVTTTPT
ncbi:NHL repeat-containing protein [Hamadaea tsunoensis]|uniref:PQQ-like beta-propeller repeat protein n=1 Tax=Hamadaea tsunoensis TaxID=53368 RepID=UPI000416152A|nr:PQQ-like beta-propeller repeat protein [Hamadaea tsunoensis]